MKKLLLKFGLVLLAIIVVLGVFSFFALYLPFKNIQAKATVLQATAKQFKGDLKQNDIDLLKTRMTQLTKEYKDFEDASKSVYWMSFIPYIHDFKSGVEAGHYMVDAGGKGVAAAEPYADLIGFKKGGGAGIKGQSADERLATAVVTLDKLKDDIGPISEDIKQAELKLDTIDPNRYPEKIGNREIRPQLISIKTQFQGLKSLFVDAEPLLKRLPEMMGSKKENTYLVLYENDMEQRPAWGFLTYYAIIKINAGKLTIVNSKDIYSLDSSISSHPPAPRIIDTYHINVPQFYIRDSNLSPDFAESVKLFNSLYDKSSDKVNYDGVIAVDSKMLVDMLKIYGDLNVDGVNFSANTDPYCDCPQVIYKLFDLVDKPTPYLRENRKSILGDLMQELMRNVFGRGTLIGTFSQSIFQSLDQKHIALYFKDPDLQKSVEGLNYAGRVKEFDGDYLNVNNANFAGAKSNIYVEKTITSDTMINGNSIERKVTVTFRNPKPGSDCNLERGNLCLNAKLRDLIRVYVPKGSQLEEIKGAIIKDPKYKQYEDLGKTVFEAYIEVLPLGKAQATFTYKLPTSINAQNYKLLIQKQSGEDMATLNVNVDGASKFTGKFEKDMEIRK
jgi:hypothetical protein